MTDQPNYGFTPGPGPQGMPPPGYAPQGGPPPGNGMAVAALVLGILALVLCIVPFLNWILAILGVVFGALGMSKANKIGGKGKGLAITGLILGCVGALIGTIIFIWAIQATRNARSYRSYGQVTVPATQTLAQVAMPAPDRG